jgi:hypothetical protein
MSCRTLSKGAGTVLFTLLMQRAAGRYARFRRTSLNRQMLLTYQLPNFEEVVSRDGDDYLYENDLTVVAEYPEYIQIDINHGDGDKEAVQVLGANGCIGRRRSSRSSRAPTRCNRCSSPTTH